MGPGFGDTQTGHAMHGAAGVQLDVAPATADWVAGGVFGGFPSPLWTATGLHAVSSAPSTIHAINFMDDKAGPAMWVIFLEMGVALGLLLLIVWWTWPKKRPEDEDKR